VSGMTLLVEPASMWATVTTAGSKASTRRVTIDCRARTISAATGIGSAAACGSEACPPRPCTTIRHWSAAAIIGPGRTLTLPLASVEETCRANAPLTGAPGTTSSSPSSSM
jgi:hypothetical protein